MGLSILEKVRSVETPDGRTLYVIRDLCVELGIVGYLSLLRRVPDIHREVINLKDYGMKRCEVNATDLTGALNIIMRHGKENYKEMFALFAELLKKDELV